MPKFHPNGSTAVLFSINEQNAIALKKLMAAWEDDVKDESPSADALNTGTCRSYSCEWFVTNLVSSSILVNIHSALIPDKLSKLSPIVETIEQLTLCKYRGRPHWGKNYERVVRHPKCKVREHYPAANIAELLEMQQQHDPRKVFEPELFKQVLQKRGPKYSRLCTPHYWCYCAADQHCPPGFQCRGSASFPEYKICRLV